MRTYYKEVCLNDGSFYEGMGYDMGRKFVFHGNGKLYDKKGELFYEGDFYDGKRNGKGKEYLLGNLYYEGDFLNGSKHGSGTQYVRGRLLYKGEFQHNTPYGSGISYSEDGSISKAGKFIEGYYYEGDLVDGKACGEGRLYYIGSLKLRYEGDMKDDKPNGNGIQYNFGTCDYRGEFANGCPHGRGRRCFLHGRIREGFFVHGHYYVGNIYGGKPNGKGRLYDFQNYLSYEGDFADGVEHGQGRQYFLAKYLCYEGDFVKGCREGQGKQYINNVLAYEGGLKNGHWQGKGTWYIDGTIFYKGDFVHGRKHGRGMQFDRYGNLRYIGDFSNGRLHGKGSAYENGKLIYKGDFYNGEARGQGIAYSNGRLFYEGEFLEGEPHGLGRMYAPDGSIREEGIFSGDKLVERVPFLHSSTAEVPMKAPLAEVPKVSVKAPMAPPLPPKENLILKEERTEVQGIERDSHEGTPGF